MVKTTSAPNLKQSWPPQYFIQEYTLILFHKWLYCTSQKVRKLWLVTALNVPFSILIERWTTHNTKAALLTSFSVCKLPCKNSDNQYSVMPWQPRHHVTLKDKEPCEHARGLYIVIKPESKWEFSHDILHDCIRDSGLNFSAYYLLIGLSLIPGAFSLGDNASKKMQIKWIWRKRMNFSCIRNCLCWKAVDTFKSHAIIKVPKW